jgi:hypothetical protein
MGYSPAEIAVQQGAGVGGSVTMHQATNFDVKIMERRKQFSLTQV